MSAEPDPCKPCHITRTVPTYPFFSLGCLHCGARIIQHLGTLCLTREQIASRRRENLMHWVAFGHNEAQIRALAKQDTPAIAPRTPAKAVACAVLSPGKPR